MRQPDPIAAAFDAVEAELGLASVLVNNAAGNFPVPAEDLSPNGWRAVVDSVLNGTFFCSREFGRRHIAAGTPGSILNIGAAYAWTGGPGFAHSAAAKAGVKNLTETLAVEWGPYGIRVNGLVPGLFPHEDEVAAIRGVPERGAGEDRRAPAGRVGRPRELGWAATFLASPFASYITGHTLVVDGANWQRRSLTNPPVVPIRDQMGRGPFDLTDARCSGPAPSWAPGRHFFPAGISPAPCGSAAARSSVIGVYVRLPSGSQRGTWERRPGRGNRGHAARRRKVPGGSSPAARAAWVAPPTTRGRARRSIEMSASGAGGLALAVEGLGHLADQHRVAQRHQLGLDGDEGQLLDGPGPADDATAVAHEQGRLVAEGEGTNTLSMAFLSTPDRLWLYSGVIMT